MQWMDCFISQIKSDKTAQLQEEVMVTRQASWINNLVSRTGALMIKRPADTALLSVASARSRNSLCVCPRMAVAWMTGASLLQQCWSLPLTVTIFGRVWYTATTIQVCFRNGVKNNCYIYWVYSGYFVTAFLQNKRKTIHIWWVLIWL